MDLRITYSTVKMRTIARRAAIDGGISYLFHHRIDGQMVSKGAGGLILAAGTTATAIRLCGRNSTSDILRHSNGSEQNSSTQFSSSPPRTPSLFGTKKNKNKSRCGRDTFPLVLVSSSQYTQQVFGSRQVASALHTTAKPLLLLFPSHWSNSSPFSLPQSAFKLHSRQSLFSTHKELVS